MTDEVSVDAYGESERCVGFFTMLEDNLELPFSTFRDEAAEWRTCD
jgi:hypothetical protein